MIVSRAACQLESYVSPEPHSVTRIAKKPIWHRMESREDVKDWFRDREQKYTFIVASSKKCIPNVLEEAQFSALATQWRKETALYSNLSKKVMHPAYQAIIGMGKAAIPLILREMMVRPGHWFWALDSVTYFLTHGKSPADSANDFDDATRLWIQWGEQNGFI